MVLSLASLIDHIAARSRPLFWALLRPGEVDEVRLYLSLRQADYILLTIHASDGSPFACHCWATAVPVGASSPPQTMRPLIALAMLCASRHAHAGAALDLSERWARIAAAGDTTHTTTERTHEPAGIPQR